MDYMLDYLDKNKDVSMAQMPFGPVDALILSQFVYFKWEHVIPGLIDGVEALSLKELEDKMYEAEVFSDPMYQDNNKRLWDMMVHGKRFGGMRCNYLSSELDDAAETQFFAITVFPEDTLPIVVFRGTDDTILGWKEDANMSFTEPVPGQLFAALYVKQVALRLSGEFMTAGHSKGGNLAIYAAFAASEDVQQRISNIYCFDGPGFRQKVLDELVYGDVAKRIHKFIPQSSAVGIILEKTDDYKVVKSSKKSGALQHNPYTWAVDGNDFAYLDEISKGALRFREKMNAWLGNVDDDDLRVFWDTIFDILNASDATTTREMARDPITSQKAAYEAVQGLDEETKDIIKEVARQYIKS